MQRLKLTVIKIVLFSIIIAAVFLGKADVVWAEDGSEEIVLYDASEFPEFAGRTQETALKKYIEAIYKGPSFQDGKAETYYKKAPGLNGNDDPGEMSKDTMDSMAALVNYYRYLAGLSPVTCTDDYYYSPLLQKEAREFAASLKNPSDPSLKIMSRGYTPLKSVINWTHGEMSYISSVYYDRRKMFDPGISKIYLGYSNGGGAYYETEGKNTTNLPFVAYPGQGYMPKNLIEDFDTEVWEIKLDGEKISFSDAGNSGVTVIITDPDGNTYTLTKAAETIEFYDLWFGFSLPKRTEGSWPLGTYKVEVTGLTDVATGNPAKLRYSTTFFDATEALNTEVSGCSINGAKKLVLPSSMTTEANLNSVAGILPKEITVTAANGRMLRLPAKGAWVADKVNSCFKNSALEGWLPSEVKDETHMLDSVCIPYETAEAPNAISLNFRNLSSGDKNLPPNSNIAGHGCAFSVTKPSAGDMENCIIYYSKAGTSPYTVFRDSRIDYSSRKLEKKEDGSFEVSTYFAAEEDSGSLFAICFTDGKETAYISDAIYITVLPKDTSTTPTTPTTPTNPTDPTDPTTPTTPTDPINPTNPTTPTDPTNPTNPTNPSDSSNQTPSSDCEEDDEKGNGEKPVSRVPKVDEVKLKSPVVKKKGSKRTVTLKWKNAKTFDGVTGYQIQIATNKKYKNAKNKYVAKTKTNCKISGLKKNKKYFIRVRGYKQYMDGGKKNKAYGKWKKQTVRT